MGLRVVSLLALALGMAALVLAGWGLIGASDDSRNVAAFILQQRIEMDAAEWLFRWRLSLGVIGAAGAIVLVSGVAVLRGRLWGLLSISAAVICVAAFPWIVRVTLGTRYPFEAPDLLETSVLLAVAAAAAGYYFQGRHHDAAA